MNQEFMKWLASDDAPFFFFEGRYGGNGTVVKMKKTDSLYYLFCQMSYGKEWLSSCDKFEYIGLYCIKDNRLYDARGRLFEIDGDEELLKRTTAKALKEDLQQRVRKKVEAVIGNDRKNLKVSELTDMSLLWEINRTREYRAANDARIQFLKNDSYTPPVFQCSYTPDEWTDESMMSYILDPDGYAENKAQSFIDNYQQDMLLCFLINDELNKAYKAIWENVNDPVHIVKKIMLAMKNSTAKTVNVTIVKNGVEFTFKTDAHELRMDCKSSYSTWDIIAADRRRFKDLFGPHTYYPQEIIRITYGKKVLYEAENKQ